MSESKPAPGEQFMTVRDFSQLVSKARDFLTKYYAFVQQVIYLSRDAKRPVH